MTLRDGLQKRGIKFHLAPNNHLSMCCLFCADKGETVDERFRLSVNLSTGAAICFNCGWSAGGKAGIARILQRLKFAVADVDPDAVVPEVRKSIELPADFQLLHQPASDLDRKALQYAINRGLTLGQLSRNKVGVSFVGRLAYRIVFPVFQDRKLLGLVARDFTGTQEPKYLNSLGEKSLYNLSSARPGARVILSEGVFKALRIERVCAGFASFAMLGKTITEHQLQQLKDVGCREIIIWPDPDRPGRRGAIDIADKLGDAGFMVGVVWPVHVPADDEDFQSMANTWQRLEGYSTGLRRRLQLGVT